MPLLFHARPPLLTPTLWVNKLPQPDMCFPSRDVGEKVRYVFLSVNKEYIFIEDSLTSLTLLCIFNGSLYLCMWFNSDQYLTLDVLILNGGSNKIGRVCYGSQAFYNYATSLSSIALSIEAI